MRLWLRRGLWGQGGTFAGPQGILVAGGVLAIGTIGFFRPPLLPSIGRDLSMSPGQLGLLTTVFAVGRLVMDIPAGRITDRYATVRVMAGAALAVAAGSFMLGWATIPLWAWGASFVLGVASAMSNTAGMAFFSSSAPARRRGTSLAVFSAALLIGQAIGPALAGLLASLGTWRTTMVAGGGIGLAVAWVMMRGSPVAADSKRDPGPRTGVWLEAPRREAVVLYAVSFVMFFALGAMPQTLIPIIGDDRLGLSAGAIGLALGFGGVWQLVGAVVGGQITDRVSRKAALLPALILQAAGIVMLVGSRSLAWWLAGIAVTSLTTFALAASATMIGDRAPAGGVGQAFGTFRFVGDVGLVTGPTVAAQLYERVGQAAAVFTVAGVVAVCALAAALVLREIPLSDGPGE